MPDSPDWMQEELLQSLRTSPFNRALPKGPAQTLSPRIGAVSHRGPARGPSSAALAATGSEAGHTLKSARLTPRPPSRSLANMMLENKQMEAGAQEAQRRRDLTATKSGLEVRLSLQTHFGKTTSLHQQSVYAIHIRQADRFSGLCAR